MRRTRFVMLAAMVVGGLAALDASAASAALPEIGRCVKLEGAKEGHTTKYGGKYTNKKCTLESSTSTGKFEWMPGAGAEKGFESPGTLEPVTLKTAAGTAIECKNSKQVGEYTSATTEKDEISLYECTLSTTKETCQSLRPEETPPTPEPGTIISQPVEGTLGFIKKSGARPELGWDYKAKTGTALFIFECGGTALPPPPTTPPAGEVPGGPTLEPPSGPPSAPNATVPTAVTIEGSFISQIIRPVNKMAEEYKLRSAAAGGKQSPEMFEGGAADTLTVTFLEPLTLKSTKEAIGYSAPEEEQSFGEDLEFKATP
jgi:hypothetical protein